MAATYQGHYDSALSSFAAGYSNGDFLADHAAPIVEVEKMSDIYQKFERKDTARIYDDLISSNGLATEIAYAVGDDPYLCKARALKGFTNSVVQMNADAPHDPAERAVRLALHGLMMGRERRVSLLATTAANYASANQISASVVWSNESTGTPLANIHSGIEQIAPSPDGESELTAFCSLEVANLLRRHPDFQGGGALKGTEQMESIAEQCGLDRILVSNAQFNSANSGATPVYARMWDVTKFVILRVPKTDALVSEGLPFATFRATRATGGPAAVRRWEEPSRGLGGSECVQVEIADDEKSVQNDMGAIISAVTA